MIGRYEVLHEIGRGGMAIVYVARQPDLDRQVALKELSRFHAGSVEYAHRFLRESRLAGSLNHPNIVTVYEYFEHATIPYIAMEYVPRGSLRPYMRRMTLAQIAGVLEGVLAGLAHAEAAGIVHRDLKPENIMVTGDGRVKITDFGIARATQRAGTQYVTATGMTVGTPTYMAPEQAMAGEIGPWSDLYSVGVLTYELVVGQVPFHDTEAPMVILMRHVNERIPPPIEVRPDVDPALSRWIDSLLVKDPAQRVRHAVNAWESLEDIMVGLLGPLWRRNARLLNDERAALLAQPLTPASFESQPSIRTPTPESSPAILDDEFVTYDPGQPIAAPLPPPSDTAPPPGTEPSATEPAATAPPATEPPAEEPPPAERAPGQSLPDEPLPDEAARADPEFVTYASSPASGGASAPADSGPPPMAESEPAELPQPELPTIEPVAVSAESPPTIEHPPDVVHEPTPEPAISSPAERTARSGRRSRRAPLVALAAVAAAIGAALGFALAPSSHKAARQAAKLAQPASAGPLTIHIPTDWQQSSAVPSEASSLRLVDSQTVSPAGSASGALVFGTALAVDSNLLPAGFTAALTGALQGSPVKLGRYTYRRYLDLQLKGSGGQLSVYSLPTSHGTAIATCVLPQAGATTFAVTCEHVVSSMRSSAAVLPLTASPSYAHKLSAVMTELNRARSADGGKLSAATRPGGQAAAARSLAANYRRAATSASALDPGPPGSHAAAAVVAALHQLTSSYQSLAASAQRNDKRGYGTAQTAIAHDQLRLSRGFAQLRQAGYTLS